MASQLSPRDREQIDAGIKEKYNKVAMTPNGHFSYPTGREGLKALEYDDRLISGLPNSVADSYCGVGNIFSLGDIEPGAKVLDIGCGAGVDVFLAASSVGNSGEVLGIDLTPEMIQKANANKETTKSANAVFRVAGIQDLTEMDEHFDVIISNGVFNLIPDKDDAIAAAMKLLKSGGKLFIADQFLAGPMTKDIKARVDSWFQ
jgi:2-polyprenyl-3-methyl-5-hydroxy-6-metoxy-1,4-benzoquinol methylase